MKEIARVSGLSTPLRIRQLQRRLYCKAKQEEAYRFYTLCDKTFRMDILSHAYGVVRRNGGSAGIDGISFAMIEQEDGKDQFLSCLSRELQSGQYRPDAVKRVYIPKPDGSRRALGIPTIRDRIVQAAVKTVIEPVFEADFEEYSYGFRPKRSAHQAIKDISRHLIWGKTQVLDIDLKQYFDSIPHDRLLKLISRRIADKGILRLIRQWLQAPVAEDNDQGRSIMRGGRKNKTGTPQGGVISPLLSNIYLHELDRYWRIQHVEARLQARLVRYADDFVILCKRDPELVYREVLKVLHELELHVNEHKSKQINVHCETLHFLGFAIRMRRNHLSGKIFPMVKPSSKALQHIRSRIKALTGRDRFNQNPAEVIQRVNRCVRGWVGYFRFGHCSKDLSTLKYYLFCRLRCFLNRRIRRYAWNRYLTQRDLEDRYDLYRVPTTSPYRRPAHALQ